MKKTLLALAALTAFAGAASAQSSVTVFGIVDLSVNQINNSSAGTVSVLSSDGLNSNRLGFRGIEDLGGGLRAGFWIEGGMANDTGTGGGPGGAMVWTRRSTLSLLANWGEIRMGRDYAATFSNKTQYDPFGTNGLASELNLESVGLSQSSTTLVRISNSVAYILPAMGGLFGNFQVAAGENTTGQKYYGGRLGYAAGPFSIAGAYGITPKTGTMLTDYKDTNFGGSWAFGPFALMGQWGKTEYNSLSQEKWLVGGTWTMGQGTLKASYVKADGSGTYTTPTGVKVGLSGDQFGLGYQYDLSKRTALYTTYAKISNGGDAATGSRYSVQQGGPAMKFGGESSSGFAVGMRHSF